MPMSCTGRVAVVTGASRGIGQAIAVRLAAEGAQVAIVGRPPGRRETALAGSLDETLASVRAVGGSAVPVLADLTSDADRRHIIDVASQSFGSAPDVLVHAAAAPREFGGGKPPVAFAETSYDRFREAVDVNVWAFWALTELLVPGMRRRGAGWALAISSSQAAPRPRPGEDGPGVRLGGACLYGGTKAFLDRIVTGAALELCADNIAVNALSPIGPVRTPLSETVVGDLPPEAWEPMETMVEAALALCTGDPRTLTSRVAYSLPLLAELGRPVRTLDGARLFERWQPGQDHDRRFNAAYLTGH